MAWFKSTEKFLQAVKEGDRDRVLEYLKDKEGNWIHRRLNNKQTVLHHAAIHSESNMVELLLQHGAEINAQDDIGATPLFYAARNKRENAMRKLLSWGSDPNVKNKYDGTALDSSIYIAHADGVRLLFSYDAKVTESHIWSALGKDETVANLIIEHADNLNIRNNNYRTPLMQAAATGKLTTAMLLLQRGADIQARDNDGDTALHHAVENDRLNLIEYLISQNIALDYENKKGMTAHALAVKKKYTQAAKILYQASAEKNSGGPQAETLPLPSPAPAAAADDAATPSPARDSWIRMGDGMIARVGTYPEIGQKLTEIFNFENAERIILIQNLQNQSQCAIPPQPFGQIEDDILEKAKTAFIEQKGDPAVFKKASTPKVKKL